MSWHIKYLQDYQDWRRGGDGEQPDPKVLGEVLDWVIARLKEVK